MITDLQIANHTLAFFCKFQFTADKFINYKTARNVGKKIIIFVWPWYKFLKKYFKTLKNAAPEVSSSRKVIKAVPR